MDGFWIDRYPVTNERFARFVEATGHITFAEIPPHPAHYPGALPHMLYAGSLVFELPAGPVDRRNVGNWWSFKRGADWRHPQGSSTSIQNRERHPVVHVAFGDAEAFAKWEGKSLPTEAEWECAARGGVEDAPYAWGDAFMAEGRHMARKVIKGGSHLCAPNYCRRYRPRVSRNPSLPPPAISAFPASCARHRRSGSSAVS